jgi:hypothetical protein
LDDSFTLEHLSQFVGLWSAIQDEHIEEATEDNISWKLMESGKYYAKLAYALQFIRGNHFHFIQDGVEGLDPS